MSNEKECIIILGMHRSGTSAVTRVLNILGYELFSDLVEAKKGDNDLGYWESKEVVDINDEFLEKNNLHYGDPVLLEESWWNDCEHIDESRNRIQQLLDKNNIDNLHHLVIKDPRISYTLPLWKNVLEKYFKIKFLVLIRHPLEICNSMSKRDPNFSRLEGLFLWSSYLFNAIKNSQYDQRLFLLYSDILEKPIDLAIQMSNIFNIDKQNIESKQDEISNFLDGKHKHHDYKSLSDQIFEQSIFNHLFLSFKNLAHQKSISKNLEFISKLYDDVSEIYKHFKKMRSSIQAPLKKSLSEYEQNLETKNQEIIALCKECDTIKKLIHQRDKELYDHVEIIKQKENEIFELGDQLKGIISDKDKVIEEQNEKITDLEIKEKFLYDIKKTLTFRFLKKIKVFSS